MISVRNFSWFLLLGWLVMASLGVAQAQSQGARPAGADEPKKYVLGGITVSGTRYLDPNTLVGLSGLRIGDNITIPGEEIGKAIRKLWAQGILGDVNLDCFFSRA